MAVVFFAVARPLGGFMNDNSHCVFPHMERNPPRPSPLSVQGVGTAASQLTLRYPVWGDVILTMMERTKFTVCHSNLPFQNFKAEKGVRPKLQT